MPPDVLHPRAERVPRFPEHVGRYEILLPIASGGMATVYLARGSARTGGIDREVALKLTHAHLRQDQDFARHLVEEAKLAAGIFHANVVPILDVGDDPLGIYLVMEYVDGDTLGNLLHKGDNRGVPPSLAVGLRVLLDALAGLHAAHELSDQDGQSTGLVHRDFTPDNILVGLDGRARLTDFGIAKAASRLEHTATGIVKGKFAYMSPEQARKRNLDRRSDVFSAGVIAWELVANRRLHESGSDVALLYKVAHEPPPPLSAVAPDVPYALEQAVASALTAEPETRCPSAFEFARRLMEAARPAGLLASHEQVAQELQRLLGSKLHRRHKRIQESRGLLARRLALAAETEPTDAYTPIFRRAPISSAETHPILADTSPALARPLLMSRTVPAAPTDRWFRGPAGHLRMAVALAVGALSALALSVFWGVGGDEGQAQISSFPAQGPPTQTEPTAEPTASAPSATLPEVSSPPPRQIQVVSNAKITQLEIGNQVIPIPQPDTKVTVDLAPGLDPDSVSVIATAADGRKARAQLAHDQARLSLPFPAPAARPTKASVSAVLLAPNPYAK